MGDTLIPPVPPPADPALLAAANRALVEQVAALEAETARLRAIIAAERGLAAPEGWVSNGEGWSNFGDEWDDNSRHARPVSRGAWNGQEFLSGTWWEWSIDERIGGLLMPGRRGRGYAPTALEAMEAADAAAGVTRG